MSSIRSPCLVDGPGLAQRAVHTAQVHHEPPARHPLVADRSMLPRQRLMVEHHVRCLAPTRLTVLELSKDRAPAVENECLEAVE